MPTSAARAATRCRTRERPGAGVLRSSRTGVIGILTLWASDLDEVVRLPQGTRKQTAGLAIVDEIYFLSVPVQRSADLRGNGPQVTGRCRCESGHLVHRALRPDSHLLNEILGVLQGHIGALDGLSLSRRTLGVTSLAVQFVPDPVHIQARLASVESKAVRTVVLSHGVVVPLAGVAAPDAELVRVVQRILHDELVVLVENRLQVEHIAGVV